MINKQVFGTIFIFISSLVILSCDMSLPKGIVFDKERFDMEWAAWEAQGLENYSMLQEYGYSSSAYYRPYSHPSYTEGVEAFIIVQDNAIIQKEILYLDGKTKQDMKKSPDYTPAVLDEIQTVSAIYSSVNSFYQDIIDGYLREEGYLLIKITYDQKLHYPKHIRISLVEDDVIGGGPSDRKTEIIRSISEIKPLSFPAEE